MDNFTVPAGHMRAKGGFLFNNHDIFIFFAQFMSNGQTNNACANNNGIKFVGFSYF